MQTVANNPRCFSDTIPYLSHVSTMTYCFCETTAFLLYEWDKDEILIQSSY